MATVVNSLKKNLISTEIISKSLVSTKKSVSSVNDSVKNISNIILTNTRIKRELFNSSQIIESRRLEASKRKEYEDQLEASKVSSSPERGILFASKSSGGPLSRLLGFLGFITSGWILENLPTWIFMGREFISRIEAFGRSMYNMVNNMQRILQSFGTVLSNSFSSIARLDFNEFTEGSVLQSFNELNLAIQDLGDNITDSFKLFTTPLTESVETGEQAPGLEEKQPDTMFPQIPQEGSIIRVTGIHKQALDIIAGPESGGSYNAMNQGTVGPNNKIVGSTLDSKQKIGKELTSMTLGEVMQRQAYLMDKRNPQISNYGIYAAGKYQIIPKTFPSAMSGAGLTPKDMFSPENQDKMGLAVLKSQGIGAWTSGGTRYSSRETAIIKEAQRTPVVYSSTPKPSNSTAPTAPATVQPAPMVVTSGFGWRWGRQHDGIDLVPKTGKVEGTPVIIRKGGIVEYAYIASRNMGMILITHEDGTQSRYLHVNNFKVKKGQKVESGQTIASLAAMGASGIGNATAPHLHFEYYPSTSAPPTDPAGVYQNYVSLGGKVIGVSPKPLDPRQVSRSPSAQISPQSREVQAESTVITPERKGSQILIIDDTKPQVSQVSYPSALRSSYSPTITEFTVLNNFIKKKLLLDLAYT